MGPDFSGYATKAGLKCSDGRTIMPDAFKHQDKVTVPLVWHHKGTDDPENILGHAILQAREDGIYTEAYFNETPKAKIAKQVVQHGDIKHLSILANELVEKSKQVFHGAIREVSLVMAGANPGALIDFVAIRHSDGSVEQFDDEAVIYTGLEIEVAHADSSDDSDNDEGGETIEDVYNSFTDKQKDVVGYMLGEALAKGNSEGTSAEHSDDTSSEENNDEGNLTHQEGNDAMTRNVFEQNDATGQAAAPGGTLTHDQLSTIVADGHKLGSFKEAYLAHADEYGITNIEELFPDAKTIDGKPEWITRRMEWVETVLNGTRKLPFSKIKSMSADLTHEEARAKGYIKSSMKKTQFFEVAHRETGPKTIYKKQQLDRDDKIDFTEFDVVAWLWVEMRFMLREEIARAILVGDGREVDDPDKIDENKIRPIAHDEDFYTDKVQVPTNVNGESLVEAVVRSRENYKGDGEPSAFMTRAVLNNMLFAKDKIGRRLWSTRAELANALEVDRIVLVPVMEGAVHNGDDILMILVNLSDYAVGSTRGGEITTFEDFDIDFNQYKYLIEGRMSGALTKHKRAQVFLRTGGGTQAEVVAPDFDAETGVITIPTVTGVTYEVDDVTAEAGAQPALDPGETVTVEATANEGYYFPHNTDTDWSFTRPAG